MNQDAIYHETWPRLFALAYRMTGSVADAEDVIQEAWSRLLVQPEGSVASPPGWLYRTVSNLAIDALRNGKRTATGYHGPWLPEPLIADSYARGPETEAILREDLSMALLLMLEELTPVQRAVWVLRTTLDLSFAEIGEIVERSEQTCRQVFHRAGAKLRGRDATVLETASPVLVGAFLGAVQSGDISAVASMLLDDAVWIGDGGGVRPATMRPVVGAEHVARGVTMLVAKSAGPDWRAEVMGINGGLGLLVYEHDVLDSAWMFISDGERISHVLAMRNPHKMRGLAARV